MPFQYVRIAFSGGIVGEGFQEILNGRVVRITDAEGNTMDASIPHEESIVDSAPESPIWSTEPAPTESPVTPTTTRHITRFAFRQRFTSAERASVEFAATDNPASPPQQRQLAAALRSFLRDTSEAQFIDLDMPDLQAGLLTLEGVGLLGAGRANEILSAEVSTTEEYRA